MPHGITQCYLPPGRGRLSDPGRMQGWVDLDIIASQQGNRRFAVSGVYRNRYERWVGISPLMHVRSAHMLWVGYSVTATDRMRWTLEPQSINVYIDLQQAVRPSSEISQEIILLAARSSRSSARVCVCGQLTKKNDLWPRSLAPSIGSFVFEWLVVPVQITITSSTHRAMKL